MADDNELNKKLAIEYFNGTWDLLDKTDRTTAEDFDMLHMAHASCFHWSRAGTAQNIARGEWQVSHVCAVLKQGEAALYHGQRSLDLCNENDIADLDLAFGYEAVARAYAVLGDTAKAAEAKARAREAAQAIADDGDKTYCLGEIESVG
ncbi:hypothetical protein FACS189483_00260 [Spirochaetia bacterium]|nr:hypothetical protein FACS189483_00260 [Spirochaetia bacterium]